MENDKLVKNNTEYKHLLFYANRFKTTIHFILFLIIIVIITSCSSKNSISNNVIIGKSSDELINRRYENVEQYLTNLGFTNIVYKVKNIDTYKGEYIITNIKINGKRDFDKNQSFSTDDKIVIQYGERKHDEFTYDDIEYDQCFEFHRRGGYSYYLFDYDSDVCLYVGKSSVNPLRGKYFKYSISGKRIYIDKGSNNIEEFVFLDDRKKMKTSGGEIEYENYSVRSIISTIKKKDYFYISPYKE